MNKKELLNHRQKHKNELVIVTGGNSGIGFEFIRHLLREEYQVIFTVRSKEKGEAALKIFKEDFRKPKISYMLLDLASFNSINNFVNEIIKKKIDVHHLYHNAGVFRIPFALDENGLEINTKTNYFGPYLLNEKLIPYFLTLKHEVHINFTFSLTTYFYRLNYKYFNPPKQLGKMKTYARSKIMIVHYYHSLTMRYPQSNLRFTLSHPGSAYTALIDKGYKFKIFKFFAILFMKIFFHTAKKASYTYLLSLKERREENYYITPRGFMELSGYPKYKKIKEKRYKNFLKTVQKTEELLKKYY